VKSVVALLRRSPLNDAIEVNRLWRLQRIITKYLFLKKRGINLLLSNDWLREVFLGDIRCDSIRFNVCADGLLSWLRKQRSLFEISVRTFHETILQAKWVNPQASFFLWRSEDNTTVSAVWVRHTQRAVLNFLAILLVGCYDREQMLVLRTQREDIGVRNAGSFVCLFPPTLGVKPSDNILIASFFKFKDQECFSRESLKCLS